MSNLIQIQNQDLRPRTICQHCQKEILIDIMPFSKDCTKIMQDKCPNCHGKLFVGILILAHPDMNGLLKCIQIVIDAMQGSNKIIGGEK